MFVRLGQNGQSNNNIPANGRFPAAGAGGKPNGDSDISPQRPTPDPYEFSDEASDTFPNKPQRRSRSSREGSFASVQSFKQVIKLFNCLQLHMHRTALQFVVNLP